jgi:hypothetical protein
MHPRLCEYSGLVGIVVESLDMGGHSLLYTRMALEPGNEFLHLLEGSIS